MQVETAQLLRQHKQISVKNKTIAPETKVVQNQQGQTVRLWNHETDKKRTLHVVGK